MYHMRLMERQQKIDFDLRRNKNRTSVYPKELIDKNLMTSVCCQRMIVLSQYCAFTELDCETQL